MSPFAWIKRRALEREVEKLQQQLDAKRRTLPLYPGMSIGTWFAGAGLTLASGFVSGVASALPGEFDRSGFIRLLMIASAQALKTAGAFIEQHPPAVVSDGPVEKAPGPPKPVELVDDAAATANDVTRAELMQRLRRQSAEREHTG